MTNCLHERHEATVNVIRLQEENESEPHAYTADVQIKCSQCGARFYFQGMPAGVLNDRPSVSARGDEARLPITPVPFHSMDTGGGVPPFLTISE